jgi:hypothetical protein
MRNCFILFFFTFAVFISCNDESSTYTVGEDFLEIDTKVIVTDTLSIIASTILLDSVSTTNSSRLLIGALMDEDFGNLTSQPFFNLLASDYDIDTNAIFDSIGIILYYDSYYYGDTTKIQTYKVYEIIENFDPSGDDDSFYNTSSLKYSDEILGELLFTPFPNKKDSIYIPIKNNFGNNLFNKLKNNEVNNSDELYQLFKGLTISPDTNGNNILGFSKSSMVMRMYYKLEDGDSEDNNYYRDFTIQSYTRNFNKITSDRSSTFLNSLITYKDYIKSTSTNNLTYIQSGSSLNMHVNIPYIKNFNYLEQNGTTINASLKFYPDIKSYESNSIGADSLAVYIIDHKNRLVQQLTGVDGSSVYAKYNTQNDEFNSKSYYIADITYFVEQIQTSSYNLNYSLLFQFPNNSSSVNKIKIYDAVNSENKMKLTLTYLLY